jgi:hypothetical protein
MRALRLIRHILAIAFWWILALAVVVVATLASVGQWYNPEVVKLEALGPPPITTTTASTTLMLGTTPAAAVLTQVIATSIPGFSVASPPTATSPDSPLAQTCTHAQVPAPQLVATEVLTASSGQITLSIAAYSAGFGALVRSEDQQAFTSCPYSLVTEKLPAPSSGFIGTTSNSSSSYQEMVFSIGDVVVTALSVGGSSSGAIQTFSTLATALTSALTTALTSQGCAALQYSAGEHVRNPESAAYVGLLVSQTVPIPPSDHLPDLSLINAAPPVLPVPPPGQVVTLPAAPPPPAYPSLTATIDVPTLDQVGPGCGWAFTDTVTPSPPSFNLAQAQQDALAPLLSSWTQWPARVATYLDAVATYNADMASYNLYVASTTTSTTTSSTTSTTTSTTTTIPGTTSTSLPPTTPTTTSP